MLFHVRERASPSKASHYGVDQPAVLIAAEKCWHADETKGQEESLAQCPTLDLYVLMGQMETELPSVAHGDLGT